MELSKAIKRLRTEKGWSQEALAERAYVSRQTVSNWETEKSCPDIQSLLILSDLFGVSLEELIKGDVETMKKVTVNKDAAKLKKLQFAGLAEILALMILGVPLAEYGGAAGGVVIGVLAVCIILTFHQFEQTKQQNDVQTYREYYALLNGKTLDDIEREREQQKRGAQKKLLILVAVQAIVLLVIAAVVAFKSV